MSNSDPVFRLVEGDAVTTAELERSAEILHAAFPRWPGRHRLRVPDVEHLRWKIEGAGDGPGRVAFTDLDGQIISLAIHMLARVLVKGQPRLACYATDAAMHPNYQGLGLYSKRREYSQAQWNDLYDLSYGVTHNVKVLHLREKRGTSPLENPLRTLLRPYDARRLSALDERKGRSRLRAVLYAPGVRALSLGMRILHPRRAPSSPSWSIREARGFDERADEFAKRAAEQFDLIQLRDRRFLNWRYFDPRTPNSTVLVAEECGELLGYVAYRTEGPDGYLMDLLALPGRLDVAHGLAAETDRAFRGSGVMGARCWTMRRHPYVPVLHAYGFIPSRYETGFNYRARRMPESELEFMGKPEARIHFTLADLDTL
jgi:hypothetical protein